MKTSITFFVVLFFVSTFSLFAQQQPDDPLRPSRKFSLKMQLPIKCRKDMIC
jgi:hypothetical protein